MKFFRSLCHPPSNSIWHLKILMYHSLWQAGLRYVTFTAAFSTLPRTLITKPTHYQYTRGTELMNSFVTTKHTGFVSWRDYQPTYIWCLCTVLVRPIITNCQWRQPLCSYVILCKTIHPQNDVHGLPLVFLLRLVPGDIIHISSDCFSSSGVMCQRISLENMDKQMTGF